METYDFCHVSYRIKHCIVWALLSFLLGSTQNEYIQLDIRCAFAITNTLTMMAPAKFSPNVRRTFLVVELILLITSLILLAQNVRFQLSQVTLFWQITISLAFICLGLVFPGDRPLWQKRVYIFVEISLLVVAQSMKISFEALIYLFLLKSCFLLPR
jgi:hypothetical protein